MAKVPPKKKLAGKASPKRQKEAKADKVTKPSIAETRIALEKLTKRHAALKEVRRDFIKEVKGQKAEIAELKEEIEEWREAEDAWKEKKNFFQAKIKGLEAQKISLQAQVSNLKNGNGRSDLSPLTVHRKGDVDDEDRIETLVATGFRQREELKTLKADLTAKDHELAAKSAEIARLTEQASKRAASDPVRRKN